MKRVVQRDACHRIDTGALGCSPATRFRRFAATRRATEPILRVQRHTRRDEQAVVRSRTIGPGTARRCVFQWQPSHGCTSDNDNRADNGSAHNDDDAQTRRDVRFARRCRAKVVLLFKTKPADSEHRRGSDRRSARVLAVPVWPAGCCPPSTHRDADRTPVQTTVDCAVRAERAAHNRFSVSCPVGSGDCSLRKDARWRISGVHPTRRLRPVPKERRRSDLRPADQVCVVTDGRLTSPLTLIGSGLRALG